MTSLWLVTPVFGRVERTRICLEQRARLLVELRAGGLDAHQLIVGDDENLDTARSLGFLTLERPNVLGLKINDGIEYACRAGDADFVAYVGSDDWMLPDFWLDLPPGGKARTSRWMTFVAPDGKHLASVPASAYQGHPPWTLPRSLLEPCGFRPAAKDAAMSGLDSYITGGIARGLGRELVFDYHADDDPLRCVDFKGPDEQITPWRWIAPGRYHEPRPFEKLATRYPADLCRRMEDYYAA